MRTNAHRRTASRHARNAPRHGDGKFAAYKAAEADTPTPAVPLTADEVREQFGTATPADYAAVEAEVTAELNLRFLSATDWHHVMGNNRERTPEAVAEYDKTVQERKAKNPVWQEAYDDALHFAANWRAYEDMYARAYAAGAVTELDPYIDDVWNNEADVIRPATPFDPDVSEDGPWKPQPVPYVTELHESFPGMWSRKWVREQRTRMEELRRGLEDGTVTAAEVIHIRRAFPHVMKENGTVTPAEAGYIRRTYPYGMKEIRDQLDREQALKFLDKEEARFVEALESEGRTLPEVLRAATRSMEA